VSMGSWAMRPWASRTAAASLLPLARASAARAASWDWAESTAPTKAADGSAKSGITTWPRARRWTAPIATPGAAPTPVNSCTAFLQHGVEVGARHHRHVGRDQQGESSDGDRERIDPGSESD